jgi:hypothetical protein
MSLAVAQSLSMGVGVCKKLAKTACCLVQELELHAVLS